jgi:CheY-like chemotaxis protein
MRGAPQAETPLPSIDASGACEEENMLTFEHFFGTVSPPPDFMFRCQHHLAKEKWGLVQQGQELPTVLVVEDDPLLQGVVEDALDEGGFKVTTVGSAEEAITLLTGKATTYCALITDINLPGGMDGWEIARIAREIDAAFPIIYMTGDAGDEWPSKGVPNSILLNKPFAPAQIVTAVSQLLNAGSPST